MVKKVFIFLFVGMLVIYQPVKVYADAGTLVVAGGSIATGGLSVAALASLSGPAVVIVFTALVACGMNIELTRASQEAGMTKTQFLKTKIQQYCSEAGISLGVFCDYILTETTLARNGAITLSNKARSQIIKLGNWMFENDMVSSGAGSGAAATPYVDVNNLNLPVVVQGQQIELGIRNKDGVEYPLYMTVTSCPADTVYFISDGNGRLTFISNNSGTVQATFHLQVSSPDTWNASYELVHRKSNVTNNNVWFQGDVFSVGTGITFNNGIPIYSGTWQQFINGINSQLTVVNPTGTAADSLTGDRSSWDTAKDRLANPGTVLNPGLNPGLDIPQDKNLTVDVGKYLDAIGKILDKLANPSIPAVDDATGTPVDVPIDDADVQDPAIEDDDPNPQVKTPVTDPSKPASPDLAVEPLTIQLKGVFPFCIPFDVVDMIKMLQAEPVAPSYTVNWTIPIVNQNLNFTVDLSPWNNVAAVARTMELILFCIGLAVVTRSMFIRG